jgi:hypothetical protein
MSKSNYDIFSDSVIGIEVFIYSDGYYDFYTSLLSIKRKKIEIQEINTFVKGTLKELAASYEYETIPACITISGSSIIHRKIKANAAENDQSLLNKVLPNADIADFYLQKYIIDSDEVYISVVRKSALSAFLLQSQDSGINIIKCTLSPWVTTAIFPLLPNYDVHKFNTDIIAGHFNLFVENNKISHVDTLAENSTLMVDLSGIKCESNHLLSFAVAFSYLTDSLVSQLSLEVVDLSLQELKYKKKFYKIGIIAVASFFLLLLTNFGLFIYWHNKVKLKQNELTINESIIAEVNALEKLLHDRESFFTQNGISTDAHLSLYADRIGASLPPSLILTKLSLDPVTFNEEKNKTIFTPGIIIIKGLAKYSIEVNEWINDLKKIEWVKNAKLISYKEEGIEKVGVFEIELSLKK